MKKMSTESCFVKITILVMLFPSMLSLLSPVEALAPPVPKPKVNVTEIFGNHTEFSTFVSLLNQTGLAKEILPRDTITILAVENGAIGGLASQPLSSIKDILSTHIILDYYDLVKLSLLSPKKNTTVTTMYQSSGIAERMEGYLNIVALPNVGTLPKDKIRIGSAVRGSPVNIQVLDENQPFEHKKFDYCVIRVSGVIFTRGISGLIPPPTSAPNTSPIVPPPHNKNTTTPAPSPDDDEDDYDTTAPEAAPPKAEAPVPSSPSPSADAPTADDDNADKAAASPPKSSAMHISSSAYCFTALIGVLVSSSFASAGL